jgi:hypothetical protein
VSGSRPLPFLPADGRAITLDDLTEFVAQAHTAGLPGATPIRTMGVIEFDLANGPRIARITACPGEVRP